MGIKLPCFVIAFFFFCCTAELVRRDLSEGDLSLSFDEITRDVGGGRRFTSDQILEKLRGEKQGYSLKEINLFDTSFAQVAGSRPDLGLTLLKAGKFNATIILEHPNRTDMPIGGVRFDVRLPEFSFIPLVKTKGVTITADEILGQAINATAKGYKLKEIDVVDKSFAKVVGNKSNLELKLLKEGNFNATVTLEHSDYFDVKLSVVFKVKLPLLHFNTLTRTIRGGKTITSDEILSRIPGARARGYRLKEINLVDKSFAVVTGEKPNLGLMLLKGGNFDASITLEHPDYSDVKLSKARFKVILPAFYFNTLRQTSSAGKTITSDKILSQIPGAQAQGYKLKEINLMDKSFAQVVGERPNLGIKPLKAGNFEATITLESPNYLDLKVNSRFEYSFTFEKKGNKGDIFNSVQQTKDGGYIVAANELVTAYKSICRVIRWDANGGELWRKTFDGYASSYLNGIQETLDGGCIVVGNSEKKGVAIKLDISGTQSWSRKLGVDGSSFNSIQRTTDGYIVCGQTYAGSREAMWVVKLDDRGNRLWEQIFYGIHSENLQSIQKTSDGGYIVVGYGNFDGWSSYSIAMKLDSKGNKIWMKKFGLKGYTNLFTSVQEDTDGGYVIAGRKSYKISGRWKKVAVVTKWDAKGDSVWEKPFKKVTRTYINSIQRTSDGGYIVCGITIPVSGISRGNRRDAWIAKLDNSGDEVWEKTFGDSMYDSFESIKQTSDGGYVVVGYKYGTTRKYEGWLVKLDEDGNL